MITLDAVAIGDRIGRFRRMNGMTAAQLASEAGFGLTRSVVANIETGRRNDVGVQQLLAIAWALNVPPSALLVDIFDTEGAYDGKTYVSTSNMLDWLHGWPADPFAPVRYDPVGAPATPAGELVAQTLQLQLSLHRAYIRWARNDELKGQAATDAPVSEAFERRQQDTHREVQLLERLLAKLRDEAASAGRAQS